MRGQSHSLLLVPPPPVPGDQGSFTAAYGPAIDATLKVLQRLPQSTQLMIAVPLPDIHGLIRMPRSHIYNDLQRLLGHIYTLLSLSCTRLDVDIISDSPGSVDARVVLLDYDLSSTISAESKYHMDGSLAGPIIDLATFALTRRNWSTIFSVDGEPGQTVLANYTRIANSTNPPIQCQFETVSGGVTMMEKRTGLGGALSSSIIHSVVAVGGTFDHLHAGHKLLLTASALLLQPRTEQPSVPQRLIVGITGDALLKNKKFAEYMKSWEERQDDVVNFLLSILCFTKSNFSEAVTTKTFNEPGPNGRAVHTQLLSSSVIIECVEIQDPFGPTITDESITALIVSGETRSGGKAVNEKRAEKKWHALEVFEVDVLDAQSPEAEDVNTSQSDNFASKISSTAIRKQKAERSQAS